MLQRHLREETRATTTQPVDAAYEVRPHPVHPRLKQIDIRPPILTAFFADVRDVDVQNLEYVPFMRFILADRLDQRVGNGFRQTVRDILTDRDYGGFTLGARETAGGDEDFVKLATAVSHLIGPANRDGMSGSYFARFFVKHTDDSDSYLRQAYRNVALHTDGTYVDEPTDWLLMMKMAERHAEGGESRLLHLDDWSDLGRFRRHPLSAHSFAFKAPPSKNVEKSFRRPIFHRNSSGDVGISYIDQFAQPETLEQARYLFDLSQSLETSPAIKAPRLPVGTLIMLNNHFWLHGRAFFRRNEQLHRELMRLRGGFAPDALSQSNIFGSVCTSRS
jgi:glutarate dioxygenase